MGKIDTTKVQNNQEGALSSYQRWAPSDTGRFGAKYKSNLFIGTVISCGVGTYEFIVRSADYTDYHCCTLNQSLGFINGMGTTNSALYPEGTSVLVYAAKKNYGVIIGAVPLVNLDLIKDVKAADNITYEGGFTVNTDPAYINTCIYNLNNNQPIDLGPGNIGYTNQSGLAFAILDLLLLLKSSEKAKIELFAIDDFIRVTSGQYQHTSATSILLNLNDDGYNTTELMGSPYQCEMTGIGSYTPVIEADSTPEEERAKSGKASAFKCKVTDPYIRPRFIQELGHLGGIYDFFVLNPYEPNEKRTTIEQYSTDKKYQGLFHAAIDGSGRMLMRSAAGFCFQRCDKIPIPKKRKEAWDPSGDQGGDDTKPTPKLEFIWDSTHPYAKHLQLRDAFAYYTRNAYVRFIDKQKDWFLPNEIDLTTPEDEYEKIGEDVNGKEDFNKEENKDVRSYVIMDKDGSITLRDGFGSEICMKGGNITIACPGNLEIRPGKSVVMLGGHDVIIKGKESVDITATNRDIRIKAEENMQLYSNNGGILIESAAPEFHDWEDNIGEDVVSSGIYLKAAKARVFIWANIVHLSSITMTLLEAFKQTKSNLMIAFNNVITAANQILATTKGAAMFINATQATLAGKQAILAGGDSTAIFRGSKAWIPKMEAEAKTNPYNTLLNVTNIYYTRYWEDAKAEPIDILTEELTLKNRENIKFTFRTTEQYGTMTASETYKGGDTFVVYETSWSFLASNNNKFLGGTAVENWKEIAVNETYPWPGKENYEGDCLISLTEEINIDKDMLKAFSEIENDASDKLEKNSFNNLVVVKHT